MALAPGTRVGPYAIAALIGEGGMGKVWRAHHTALKRDDALKVLPDAFASNPDRLARFQREAQVLASLNHPNIAHVYGLEQADGVQALVMELVEGETLADRIARGAIPSDEALSIAKQIAEALEAAHEQAIIHRDLKPANIKLRPDGVVKVLDFGLAKALDPQPAIDTSHSPTIASPTMMSGVGVLLGTAAYMSPEQARGKAVDKRSDIWAFGCVLYEMLTGHRAFGGEDVTDTLAAVVRAEPAWEALPVCVSPSVRAFLRRCLQKNAKERLHAIADMRLALEGVFETAATDTERSVVVTQPGWRRPLVVITATAIIASLATALAAWVLWPTVGPQPITRFDYAVPADQGFRRIGRPVLALSPDGRRFVYNTAKGLYLRTLGELEARLIPGTEQELTVPFFSPDGESVGYFQDGQLKRIALSGGGPVVICTAVNPFGVNWEPDNTILFGQPNGIMRVSANGGTPELVIPAKQGEQIDSPQLLPGGDSILFSVTTATGSAKWDEAQVVVQSLSTGERSVVVQGGSDARYLSTGHVIYAVENGLFGVAFDAASRTVFGGAVPLVQGVARASNPATATATANYAVSNDGALVYLANGSAEHRLVWVDRQGHETPLAAPTKSYGQPQLSPDGTRVAVVSDGHIWVWDNGRGTLARLTTDVESEEESPLWTTDGARIAFARVNRGAAGIFWKASDGTDEGQRLLEGGPALPASWAPDGTLLYTTRRRGDRGGADDNIGRLSMAGPPKAETLLATKFAEVRPALSPDGRWLAYESDESGQPEIYVRPFPDINSGRWLVSTSGGNEPRWAPNGHALFYRASTLMSVTIESQNTFVAHAPESLFPLTSYRIIAAVPNYDVSHDGERFLFVKPIVSPTNEAGLTFSRIIVVQHWTEELKRLVPAK